MLLDQYFNWLISKKNTCWLDHWIIYYSFKNRIIQEGNTTTVCCYVLQWFCCRFVWNYFHWLRNNRQNKLLNINSFTEMFAVVVFFWFQNASIEVSLDSCNWFSLGYGTGTIMVHYVELWISHTWENTIKCLWVAIMTLYVWQTGETFHVNQT